MPARWTVFCAMIDNYGDIGVCWRLARQLTQEHGLAVDLWVDDWAAAGRFLSAQQDGLIWAVNADQVIVAGVCVWRWHRPWPDAAALDQHIAASDCLVEAFGCELPAPVKQALSQRQHPLVWINLEYLSAEDWVSGCHGLPSPQSGSTHVKKYFFFPGFVAATGGLLRERGLLQRHARWQDQLMRGHQDWPTPLATLMAQHAINPADYDLRVSVFSYESAASGSWLNAMAEGPDTVLCLVPEGRSLQPVAGFLAADTAVDYLQPGKLVRRARLTLLVLPFMSQDNYDHLLSCCDLNLVRGEDSFVRAQWAGKPFVWHIYPQDDGVHLSKLQAFADLYLQGVNTAAREAWLRFALGWNQGEDCRELWHYLRPQLPDLLLHSREWQKKLAVMPDLATNLVNFETFTKLSVSP